MAEIKIQLNDVESIALHSSDSVSDFSFQVVGYTTNNEEENEPNVISVLLDRYQLHELILKMDMILRNQVK